MSCVFTLNVASDCTALTKAINKTSAVLRADMQIFYQYANGTFSSWKLEEAETKPT